MRRPNIIHPQAQGSGRKDKPLSVLVKEAGGKFREVDTKNEFFVPIKKVKATRKKA